MYQHRYKILLQLFQDQNSDFVVDPAGIKSISQNGLTNPNEDTILSCMATGKSRTKFWNSQLPTEV